MDIRKELEKKFDENQLKWRVQSCGLSKNGKNWAKLTPYLDVITIQERLNSIFDWDNWKTKEYINENHSVTVELILWSERKKEWITRTGTSDIVEKNSQALSDNAIKTAATSAFKRAAAAFGIGLYLKEIKEVWGKEVSKDTEDSIKCENKKDKVEFYVIPDTEKIKDKLFEKIQIQEKPKTKESLNENIIPLYKENQIGRKKAIELAEEIKKEFPNQYETIIENFKTHFRVNKLEELKENQLNLIRQSDFQLIQLKYKEFKQKVN